MKKIFFLFLSFGFVSQICAQKVIGSAGKNLSASGISINFTLGEVFEKGYSASGIKLSTGFHQNLTGASLPCNITLTVTTTNSVCQQATGTASVVASGGTAPYSYLWTNGDKTSLADSLSSGLYVVTVKDANNCTATAPALISDIGSPTITVSSVTNVSCNGGNNGAINISVSGGTSPYTFSWVNGATTQNIGNLYAGPYQIQVTDGAGCKSLKNILVTQPAPISLVVTETLASCGNADGSASVAVSGGTTPYSYSWSSGSTTANANNIPAGSYSVVVTDNKGCTNVAQATVTNSGGATITIDSIVPAGCNSGTGSIYITVSAGAPPYTYAWSNGATTQDLIGVPSGLYGLTVYGSNSCNGAFSGIIPSQIPATPAICIVTVDTFSGKNQVVFEKDSIANLGISKYKFYRESTTAGVYQLTDSILSTQLSQWTDQTANPLQRSWRYEMTAVDTCENESPVSNIHKTIHLTANLAVGNNVNLIWDNYEGFSFGTYYIWRYLPAGGWIQLNSVPSSLNSFTDFSPPSFVNLFYYIEVQHPFGGCNVSIKNPDPMATTINSTKSNTFKVIPPNGINELSLDNFVSIYPNPTNGKFEVTTDKLQIKTAEVYNIFGKKIYSSIINNHSSIINLDVPNGIYLLKIISNKGTVNKKIIIAR